MSSALSRLNGLDGASLHHVVATAQALDMGQADEAASQLKPVLFSYPDHPEVLRLHAGILMLRGDFLRAVEAMRRAAKLRPRDPLYQNTLGAILGSVGDYDAAIEALRRACELQPDLATAWFNLGVILTRCVRHAEAIGALRRAVSLAPQHMAARALLGDMLRVEGKAEEAIVEFRRIIDEQPWSGMAWWGLADIKDSVFTPQDIDCMRHALRQSGASVDDRIAIGFALARALDDYDRYAESLDALAQANALARQRQCWDAKAFSASVSATRTAFTPPPNAAGGERLGHEVVFITGLPRSGTTLVEQILASHSQIEGAGELPDLPLVIDEESRQRGRAFPGWVAEMQAADWRRLGARYLERTAHWRIHRPMFTDKLPGNWMYTDAIRAMLPGAHIVVCRRDPLETCFSCYRQHLVNNEYTRTFEDLASYWRDFDLCARHEIALHAWHVYEHDHEMLLVDPEGGIRNLLKACELPFEEACLRFHETKRDVRSPSANQVRQPLRRNTAHANRYGNLLDPLRASLGIPPYES